MHYVGEQIAKYEFTTGHLSNIMMHYSKIIYGYCRFGNVREDLIFANIREFVASRIQSSRE